MDSLQAFARGEAARASGSAMRVFDWDKAARILKERSPTTAEAGLSGDLEWTGGTIWEGCKPTTESYTFLASCWATPILIIDDEEIECWTYMEGTGWDADTKWPESALAIVK